MNDTLIHYAPVFVAGVAAVVVLLIMQGVRREGQRKKTWSVTRGRVLEIQKRTDSLNDNQTDAVFHDYYLIRCTYRTADGREITGWADRRYNQSVGKENAVIPVWYDPQHPGSFTVLPPQSTSRATVTALPALALGLVGVVVAVLFFRGGLS
jgi:hypothetical protein